MNTADRQPKPTPTRDPACCGTCAAIVSALTPEQPVKAPGQGEGSASQSGPRRLDPGEVRPGMLVEVRIKDFRVPSFSDGEFLLESFVGTTGSWLWMPGHADIGWTLWLIEDAPAPGDPDAELVERMARAIDAEPGFNVSDMAYAALRALREIRDVTPRAEQ